MIEYKNYIVDYLTEDQLIDKVKSIIKTVGENYYACHAFIELRIEVRDLIMNEIKKEHDIEKKETHMLDKIFNREIEEYRIELIIDYHNNKRKLIEKDVIKNVYIIFKDKIGYPDPNVPDYIIRARVYELNDLCPKGPNQSHNHKGDLHLR